MASPSKYSERQAGIVSYDGAAITYLTTGDAYAIVTDLIWECSHLKTKYLTFNATTKDLKVTIFGSRDGGQTFPTTAAAEFTITVGGSAVEKEITAWYSTLQIQVKPAATGQNGTLSCIRAGGPF